MISERTREKLERWGTLDPIEPIFLFDYAIHPDEFSPLPTVAATNRLVRARVRTEHEPLDIRPLCPACRRPYDPDCRLQAGLSGCCYHCGPLDWPSVLAHLRAMDEYDRER